jgi:hypothetical protein
VKALQIGSIQNSLVTCGKMLVAVGRNMWEGKTMGESEMIFMELSWIYLPIKHG